MTGLPRIIGITGYAQHGKDTIAEVLVRELGYSRVALADKMKEALLVLDPIVPHGQGPLLDRLSDIVGAEGWEGAKMIPEVRGLLQRFGTEVGRNLLGEDTWIGALAKGTKGIYAADRRIVIPDVRFQNEADWVRRNQGEVWRVIRPDFDNGIGLNHDSERQVGAIRADETFTNTGLRSEFKDRVYRRLKNRLALLEVLG